MIKQVQEVFMYDFVGNEQDTVELANKLNELIKSYNELLAKLANPIVTLDRF